MKLGAEGRQLTLLQTTQFVDGSHCMAAEEAVSLLGSHLLVAVMDPVSSHALRLSPEAYLWWHFEIHRQICHVNMIR